MRVHIRADAETKNPRAAMAPFLCVSHDLILAGGSDGRPAIREKNNYKRPRICPGIPRPGIVPRAVTAARAREFESFPQRVINRCTTNGLEILDELIRFPPVLFVGFN